LARRKETCIYGDKHGTPKIRLIMVRKVACDAFEEN
jgi:hypothetical protein